MIKVLIADDHTLFRQALQNLLHVERDIQVVAQAGDSRETVSLAKEVHPDLVLLDVSMPGQGGLGTLKELRSLRPPTKTLVLTMHPEDQYAIRFVREGADGYLTKGTDPKQLLQAIRRIALGGKYITPSLAERLAERIDYTTTDRPHETLSDREFQVLCLIAEGKTPKEIGLELCLSVKTVSTYRSRILQKLDLRNTAQIMRYAFQEQLAVAR